MKTIKQLAIEIAMNTYCFNWVGDVFEVYEKFKNETNENLHDLEYITIWQPFEEYETSLVVQYIDILIHEVEQRFNHLEVK
jgi:hypothetical protein